MSVAYAASFVFEIDFVGRASTSASQTATAISNYAVFIATLLMVIVVLGAQLAEIGGRAAVGLLSSIGPPTPNLVQARAGTLSLQAAYVPQQHTAVRHIVVLTEPDETAEALAAALDRAEGAERAQLQEPQTRIAACRRACRDARVRQVLAKASVPKVASKRRPAKLDAGTIFARNLVALAPSYD